jgi:hypothetical protein
MNDTNKAEEKGVETDTTQVDSPTTESPITGDTNDVSVSDDQGTQAETSDVKFQTEEERRAFQEMRLENKRLKEQLESSEVKESAFDMFRQTPPAGNSETVRVENFQDPVTGETNWQAYNYAMQQREQQVLQQARFEAQQTVKEEMDEANARSKFPELFADKNTEKLIASQWFFEKANGRNVPIVQIAEEFARNYKRAVSKAEKIGEERILNEVTEKEKATLTAESQTTSSAKQAQTSADLEDLSLRTRTGDENAIASRLSKISWANK